MDLVVETKSLTKKFGELFAVRNLNLNIAGGEIYGLIGPNGSGKTTAIRMLCGILKPTSGEAFILGRRVPDSSISDKIGYMPQEIAIYPDLTVRENLRFFGRIFGLKGEKLFQREEELLTFSNLKDREKDLVWKLSGGMKHRLSLACTLIHDPPILFLDEPTVGIDPELRMTFWAYLKEAARKGTTVIITTHYMDEADRCDRVGLIREGSLIAQGPPETLREEAGMESLEDVFLTFARWGGQ